MLATFKRFATTNVYDALTKEQQKDIEQWCTYCKKHEWKMSNINMWFLKRDIEQCVYDNEGSSYSIDQIKKIYSIIKLRKYGFKSKLFNKFLRTHEIFDGKDTYVIDYHLIDQFVEKTIGQLKKSVAELLPTPSCLSNIIIEYF